MRCLGRDENQCCSWFLNDRCVQFCPAPLVGNTETFDCGKFALHLYISFILLILIVHLCCAYGVFLLQVVLV